MTKQVEASMSSRRATIYRKIAEVFDALPARFTPSELYAAAKLTGVASPQQRTLVASVLTSDFKCLNIVKGNSRYWKKPTA